VTGPFWEERNANITLHGRVLPLIFVRHSDEASCETEKAKQTVAAIESVFRSTHKRDMTADERKMFGLRPLAKLKN
jgi:hypothetical protein